MIKEEYTFNHGALLQEFESKCETEGLLLIAPGGGYFTLTDNEGACVAERFAKEGFRCFVLHYATVDTQSPCGADIALKDMTAAIRLIREKDAESPLFLLGFSAGGHLCASFANTWKTEEERCGLPLGTLKPSGTVLCYPALSFAKIFQLHEDVNLPENMRQKINDFQKLICKGLGVREAVNLNPHEYDVIPHVNENTPPSFVWGTIEDELIDPDTLCQYQKALKQYGTECVLTLYAKGAHGLSLATEQSALNESMINDDIASWALAAARWMKGITA